MRDASYQPGRCGRHSAQSHRRLQDKRAEWIKSKHHYGMRRQRSGVPQLPNYPGDVRVNSRVSSWLAHSFNISTQSVPRVPHEKSYGEVYDTELADGQDHP